MNPVTTANLIQPITSQQLTPLNWNGIRPEYFKVWSDFPLTSQPFGITLNPDQLNALGQMLIAMDLIDSAIDQSHCFDSETDPQLSRLRLSDSILAWMENRDDGFPLTEILDTERLLPLRDFISQQQISDRFLRAASRVLIASEGKRNSTTVSDLVKHLIDEGQAAADMTLLVLGENTNAGLNRFLQQIMRIGTIVDTLLDADADFKNGLLQIWPSWWFGSRLKFSIARQLPALILGFPNRSLLWRYCVSYTRNDAGPLN